MLRLDASCRAKAASGGRRGPQDAAAGVAPARHWSGFLASGAIAFSVDGAVMELGVRLLGMPTLAARLVSVGCAMVAGWLAHRSLTFALRSRPTLAEFRRYVLAASTTAAINYAAFATLLLARPDTPRLLALAVASFLATIFAYLSMRYGVFRRD